MHPTGFDALCAEATAWPTLSREDRKLLSQRMRRNGWSFGEIRSIVDVPKSTLAGWCRGIELTPDQIAKIRERTGATAGTPRDTQRRRRQEISEITTEARAAVPGLMRDPFWVAGIMLYWGEGGKGKRMLTVTNTDPALLRLFIAWVRAYHLADARFVLSLHLHEGNDESRARAYWRRQLNLADAAFWKSYVKPAGSGHRKNKHPHGVCRVVTRRGTDAWIRTMAWIEALGDQSWTSGTRPVLSSPAGR